VIVVHGAQAERTPEDYRCYLVSSFREAFKLAGTQVRVDFRSESKVVDFERRALAIQRTGNWETGRPRKVRNSSLSAGLTNQRWNLRNFATNITN